MRHLSPSLTHGYGRAGPTKSTLSASDDAWRCQAPASCQSLDQQACATARSRSSRCMALSYLLLLVPKCVPWPTPVHTHRAAVGAARALLQVFRSLAAVCSPSIVAFDFRFSDRSFSATLCEIKIIQRGNHRPRQQQRQHTHTQGKRLITHPWRGPPHSRPAHLKQKRADPTTH